MAAFYNEIDPKAAAWLRELIAQGHIAPGVVDERDVRDLRPADLSGFTQCHFFAGIGVWSYALRRAGWPDDRPVWTGSCPCQPFSAAGKGKGFDDERHLWPAWFWLIEQCGPAVVFGEQVASKDAEPWLDLVQADLEALAYAVGAVPFPSAGIGAPHIRDRLWWVAHAAQQQHDGAWRSGARRRSEPPIGSTISSMENTPGEGLGRIDRVPEDIQKGGGGLLSARPSSDVSAGAPKPGPTNGYWRDSDWLLCNDPGEPVWRPVEPGTFPLVAGVAKGMGRGGDPSAQIDPVSAEARVMRLRGYGNAINADAATAFINSYAETADAIL